MICPMVSHLFFFQSQRKRWPLQEVPETHLLASWTMANHLLAS